MADRVRQEARRDGPSIVVLYTNLVHYFTAVLDRVAEDQNASIAVVCYRKPNDDPTRFDPQTQSGIRYADRSDFTRPGLIALLEERQPDIIYISGWSDRDYLHAVIRYKQANPDVSVVCGIDDQWKNSVRQWLGSLFFKLSWRKSIDFMWVSGKPQYHYAERFGYPHERIIGDLLAQSPALQTTHANLCRRFVFLGRFVPEKALDLLVESYARLPAEVRAQWPLVLIGDGPLMAMAREKAVQGVEFRGFLKMPELQVELARGGVGCITSRAEAWGVAIQELGAMGYPLILSSACGAATEFLISDYNGYLFKTGSSESLTRALEKITLLSDEQLAVFGQRSIALSARITAEQAAYSLLSVRHLREL